MISVANGVITILEKRQSLFVRVFMVVLGVALAIVLPARVLGEARWADPPGALILTAVYVLASFTGGAILIRFALARASELRLDATSGRAVWTRRGLWPDTRRFPLSDLPPPEVFMRPRPDDTMGEHPVLHLRLPEGGGIYLTSFGTRAEAEGWRDRIIGSIAGAA